jgi:hypothetical protein
VACIGTASSAVFRRVQAATVISYAVVLAMSVGTFVAYGAWMVIDATRGSDSVSRAPAAILWVNPFVLTGDAVTTENSAESGPLSALDQLVLESRARSDLADEVFAEEEVIVEPGFGRPFPAPIDRDGTGDAEEPIGFDRFGNPIFPSDVATGVPFWVESMIVLSLVAGLAVLIGARRLRTPAVAER